MHSFLVHTNAAVPQCKTRPRHLRAGIPCKNVELANSAGAMLLQSRPPLHQQRQFTLTLDTTNPRRTPAALKSKRLPLVLGRCHSKRPPRSPSSRSKSGKLMLDTSKLSRLWVFCGQWVSRLLDCVFQRFGFFQVFSVGWVDGLRDSFAEYLAHGCCDSPAQLVLFSPEMQNRASQRWHARGQGRAVNAHGVVSGQRFLLSSGDSSVQDRGYTTRSHSWRGSWGMVGSYELQATGRCNGVHNLQIDRCPWDHAHRCTKLGAQYFQIPEP